MLGISGVTFMVQLIIGITQQEIAFQIQCPGIKPRVETVEGQICAAMLAVINSYLRANLLCQRFELSVNSPIVAPTSLSFLL